MQTVLFTLLKIDLAAKGSGVIAVSGEDHMHKELSETRTFTHEEFMSALRLDILERLESLTASWRAGDWATVEFESAEALLFRLLRSYEKITATSAHMYDLGEKIETMAMVMDR